MYMCVLCRCDVFLSPHVACGSEDVIDNELLTREPQKQCQRVRQCKQVFWQRIFWGVDDVFVTSGGGKPQFWRSQKSSGCMQRHVEGDPNTLEKFHVQKFSWPKINYKYNIWEGSGLNVSILDGCFCYFLSLKAHISVMNIKKSENCLTSTSIVGAGYFFGCEWCLPKFPQNCPNNLATFCADIFPWRPLFRMTSRK